MSDTVPNSYENDVTVSSIAQNRTPSTGRSITCSWYSFPLRAWRNIDVAQLLEASMS